MNFIVKAFMEKPDGTIEVRRLSITYHNSGMFDQMKDKIASIFPVIDGRLLNISWKDKDGDLISISSDTELQDALQGLGEDTLKVYVSLLEDEKSATEKPTKEEEIGAEKHQSEASHHKDSATPVKRCTIAFSRRPKGDHKECRWLSTEISRHDDRPTRPRHQKMVGGSCPLLNMTPSAGRAIEEMKASKGRLWEKVPAKYRRWAKGYIQQWRERNVENAISTSSDEGSDKKITMEEANVPASYAQWLDVVLPEIHRGWNGEVPEKSDDDVKENLKIDVPEEFRKWCSMYLKRRFAPRSAAGSMVSPGSRKQERNGQLFVARKDQMGESLQIEHRIWTKAFIKEWHEKHALGEEIFPDNNSENDDQELLTLSGPVDIPADYQRWLIIILPMLYQNYGIPVNAEKLSGEELMAKLAEFKDTVPFGYRKWVNIYVHKILNGSKAALESVTKPFRRMPPLMRSHPTFRVEKAGVRETVDSEETYIVPPERNLYAESQPIAGVSTGTSHNESVGESLHEQRSERGKAEDLAIPPHFLAIMRKSMTEEQLRMMISQIKEQKHVARRDLRASRGSGKPPQKQFYFRYV